MPLPLFVYGATYPAGYTEGFTTVTYAPMKDWPSRSHWIVPFVTLRKVEMFKPRHELVVDNVIDAHTS